MRQLAVLGVPEGNGPQRRGQDTVMLAAAPPVRSCFRCIEVVAPLLVSYLHDGGKLPSIPNLPKPGKLGFREPGIADMESVQWLIQWESLPLDKDGLRRVAGLATYRDYYQMHDSSDVRELLAIRGSRRAVVDLTRWLRDDAESHARRLVGSIERCDLGLAQVMARLGGKPETRVPWSYLPA